MAQTNKRKHHKKKVKTKKNVSKRTHRIVFHLNDKEQEAVEAYIKKYKVKNKSRFLRETIIKAILERFMEDYPTLFEQQELDNLVINNL